MCSMLLAMETALEGISIMIQSLLKPSGNISIGLRAKECVCTAW